MLAMTSIIIDYKFKNVFLTVYILHARLGVTYRLTLPFHGPGCVNNVLINALKN